MEQEYVYSVTNTVNGRRYIGSSANVRTRCQDHLSALRLGKHYVPDLQREWSEMGEDVFRFERLATVPKNVSGNEEAAWMAFFFRLGVPLYNRQPAHIYAEKHGLVPSDPMPDPPDVLDLKNRMKSFRHR